MGTQECNHSVASLFTMRLVRIALFIALIILIINRHLLPAVFIILLLLTLELARVWSGFSLHKLVVVRKVWPCRMFPDDETTISVEVRNNKWLPIYFGWHQQLVPELSISLSEGKEDASFSSRGYLGWHAGYRFEFRLKALKRGFFRLPPLRLEAMDGFGLYKKEEHREGQDAIIVYPRLRPVGELELTAADLLGDKKDNRPMLLDPIRVAGLRDYTPDIPARFIHWKASAHKDDLLAKVMEPSADIKICVAVDVETFVHPEPDSAAFEEALSQAASLVYWADVQGIPFGLLANGSLKELSCPGVVPIGSSSGHLNAALEMLARLEMAPMGTLAELIKNESARLPWGTTHVVIGKGQAGGKLPGVHKAVYIMLARGE